MWVCVCTTSSLLMWRSTQAAKKCRDMLSLLRLQIERRLLAWNMHAGVSVDNRRPFLRFRDKLRGELDAQVKADTIALLLTACLRAA